MCELFLFVNQVKKERKDIFIKYFFEWSGARVEEIDLRGGRGVITSSHNSDDRRICQNVA